MPNEEKKFVSDDGYSHTQASVDGAGGPVKKRKADLNKDVHPDADTLDDDVTKKEENEVSSLEAIFEGNDFSEDFKSKISLVFEAAVNESVSQKVAELSEEIAEETESKVAEALESAIEEIVENLDSYLDYVVSEWMEENKLAVETGMKVERAESLLDGLRSLFAEHNVEIDESSIDVVSELEEQVEEARKLANRAINENIELSEQILELKAERVFNENTEGLTISQIERMRVLSEKLDRTDLDVYADSLETLKESFFKSNKKIITEDLTDVDTNEVLTESEAPRVRSAHPTVDAVLASLDSRSKK
jgi:hypothetical protein